MKKENFPASLEQLSQMLSWITLQLGEVEEAVSRKLELAAEEAIVNVIHHGNVDKIELSMKKSAGSIEIVIKDKGPPFDPLAHRPKIEGSTLETRKVGGLGIHLMRQCVDEVRYKRENNANVLTLIKKINHSSQKG